MATRRLSVALVFLTGCAVGGASSRFVAPIPPARAGVPVQRWEYYCVERDKASLNAVGAQGWELATTEAWTSMGTTQVATYCFKRPLP